MAETTGHYTAENEGTQTTVLQVEHVTEDKVYTCSTENSRKLEVLISAKGLFLYDVAVYQY